MNLQQRQEKIQAKRKNTPWRDFVRDICSWYNVNLYKNTGVISRFPETERSWMIYKAKDYFSRFPDGPVGVDYDSGRSFFSQFQECFVNSPKIATLDYGMNDNAEFADTVYGARNIYISISVWDNSENVLYSNMVFWDCKNVINSFQITAGSENIYYSKIVTGSYNIFYSKYIHNSQNLWFCTNMIWCHDCFLCDGLENKSYCIKNQQYTVEDYHTYIKEQRKFLSYDDLYNGISDIALNRIVDNCSGNSLAFCHDVENGYFISRVENGKNIFCGDGSPLAERVYDTVDIAKVDDSYGYMGVGQNSSHVYCGANASTCHNIYYCYFMDSCSFCLGCIWLKNKSYCILNKQYTKEERYKKVDEIFWQMEHDGILWEFFPPSMNPFYFNDTAAYLIDPSFTKEEVTKLWYLRRDEPIKVDIPEWAITVKSSELGQFESSDEQWNWKLDETVCKRVILDENGDAYRIIPMELEFLQKHGLPLPRKHWLTRMKENFRIS